MGSMEWKYMNEHEIAVALTRLTSQIETHEKDGAERSLAVVKRLDAINGKLGDHSTAINRNHEEISLLKGRWSMLGWIGGALIAGATISLTVVAILFD